MSSRNLFRETTFFEVKTKTTVLSWHCCERILTQLFRKIQCCSSFEWLQAHLKIFAGYGSTKDISVYTSIGLPPSQIYIVGRPSKKMQQQCQVLFDYFMHVLKDKAGDFLYFSYRNVQSQTNNEVILLHPYCVDSTVVTYGCLEMAPKCKYREKVVTLSHEVPNTAGTSAHVWKCGSVYRVFVVCSAT